jgi:prefoldin subunit 5
MLADGTKIVLDEASTILEIEAPEVEVPEVEVPEAPSEIELMKKKVAEMEAQLEDLKKDKKGMEVKMSESADKFTKAITELTDVVIELSKAPSAQPQTPKEAFNKHIESKNDKISRFLNMYAKK